MQTPVQVLLTRAARITETSEQCKALQERGTETIKAGKLDCAKARKVTLELYIYCIVTINI
ncbi:MAG: hypothetical protein GX267_15185 [Fibrobacter sp.]|nr:hypothetical protein [Fibrobacter sp.]